MPVLVVDQIMGFLFILLLTAFWYEIAKRCFPKPTVTDEDGLSPNDRFPWANDGNNSTSDAIKWAVEDINAAQKNIHIVTSQGRNFFWGNEDIKNALIDAKKNRKVDIVFIVGPKFNEAKEAEEWDNQNTSIIELSHYNPPIIKLRMVDKSPEEGLRIIDDRGIYVTERSKKPINPKDESRNYSRIWNVPWDVLCFTHLFDKYYRKSSPLDIGS